MSETSSSSSGSGGIGALGLLGVVFVVLKLIGEHFHTPVADWSWWWVTAPFWGGIAIVVIVAFGVGAIALLAAGLAACVEYVAAKRRQRKVR